MTLRTPQKKRSENKNDDEYFAPSRIVLRVQRTKQKSEEKKLCDYDVLLLSSFFSSKRFSSSSSSSSFVSNSKEEMFSTATNTT